MRDVIQLPSHELSQPDAELLLRTLWIQSESGRDDAMREYVIRMATAYGATIREDAIGNVYATKGEQDAIAPAYVAHLDTVHDLIPDDAYQLARYANGDLIAQDKRTGHPCGIGGDDKVGIFVALAMLRDLPNARALLTADEEIGCIGARRADLSFFDGASLAIQCDRKGNSDIVRSACSTEFYDDDLGDQLAGLLAEFGYREVSGLMTDVQELKERGLTIPAMNLSAGYWLPHQGDTYVRPSDVATCLELVRAITAELGHVPHTHTAPTRIPIRATWTPRKPATATTLTEWPRCLICHHMLLSGEEDRGVCVHCEERADAATARKQPPPPTPACPLCETNDQTEYDEYEGLLYCWDCGVFFDPDSGEIIMDDVTEANAAD